MITSDSGTEGIKKAEAEQPDAILLDIKMPEMDGYEVCRHLKSNEKTKHIPIVMLTAIKTDGESRVKGLDLGADAFLSKPINETELAAQVKVMLRIKKAEDQLRKEKTLLEDTVREKTKFLEERTHDLVERIKEMKCLYGISNLTENPGISLDEIMQGAVDLIPSSWQYPEITCAHILLEDKRYKTENFEETYWKQSSDILVHGKHMGVLEVCFLEERHEIDEGPFLKEERDLINAMTERIGHIIEKKLTEQALQESESSFSQMFEQSITSTCLYNPDGTINRVNNEFCKMFGVEEKVIINAGYNVFKDQAVINAGVIPLLRDIFDEKRSKTWEIFFDIEVASASTGTSTSKGGEIFLEIFGYPVLNRKGNLKYVVLQHYDITGRKRAEEALRESEEKLHLIIDTSPVGICTVDPLGNFVTTNLAYERMVGYSKEELRGLSFFDVTHPDNRPKNKKLFQDMFSLKTKNFFMEKRYIRKDGTMIEVAVHATGIMDAEGNARFGTAFVEDINDRKQAEESLRESEATHKKMIANISDVIGIMGVNGVMKYKSTNIEKYFGWKPEDIIGTNGWDTVHPDDLERIQKEFVSILGADNLSKTVEYRYKCKNESYKWIKLTAINLVNDPLINGVLLNYRDITERKQEEEEKNKLEAQLQQAQKMEAIGALAGGIAHDFNNVLYAVMGYTELTMDLVPEGSTAQTNLQRVMKAADRAKEMVQQILAFSRQSKKEKKPINVQSVLKEAGNLLRTSIPSTIEIRQDIDTECDAVMADPTQIHQIIMNLATNAYHAMQETGGVLGLTLMQDEIGSDDLEFSPDLKPGAYLKLTVEDTGHGIDRDVMGKIFDPYFTTKAVGKGTGMGLSVVYGIVKDHGGDIKVYSEPGQGTAFHVYLPVIETDAAEPNAISVEPAPTGTERILFVDDEEVVVNLARQMLETLGYHVTTHTGSVAALEAFRGHPDEFDLVITDMTMPKMTGAELAPRLLEIRPDIPIILCTGFSEQIDEARVGTIGIRAYLAKPILKNEMAKVIRKTLGKPNAD